MKFYNFIKQEVNNAFPEVMKPKKLTKVEVIQSFKTMLSRYDDYGLSKKYCNDMNLLLEAVVQMAVREME